ncbi:hypothetical protein [Deinococcus enclensis]|uniref:Uncharacterized protein n=1 Tax=Deinococcus enclensis TaxID=1049582 RepID=A0ABT9MFR8_9DEIO|nr:hypothetical protein [Deinococcus enclensis]MDP9765432.1 hypothetical protein [Deinococcus enclensis]
MSAEFGRYRELAARGMSPEDTAVTAIREGAGIMTAIRLVWKVFGLPLPQAKDVGADAWMSVHGQPVSQTLDD